MILPPASPAPFSDAKKLPILSNVEFESDLEQGRFACVYLLIGPEEYLLRSAVAALKRTTVPAEAHAFNLAEFKAGSNGAGMIVHEASTFPFMSARRLVLVSNLEEMPAEEHETLLTYVASPQKKTVLALICADLDRRTTFYKRLAERASVVEFKKLKGAELERWTEGILRRRGYRISQVALRKLVDLAGSDLASLMNEIEKLMLYAGQACEIQDAAVAALIPASRKHGIFELTGAIGRKDRKLALRLLCNLMELGEPPLAILGALARMFRQIIMVKELVQAGRSQTEICRVLQLPDFAVAELLQHARSMAPEVAQEMLTHLARLDRSFKSTSADERMLFERLICSI